MDTLWALRPDAAQVRIIHSLPVAERDIAVIVSRDTPAADVEVTKLTGFTSPTGNIGCYIDRDSVRCDVGDRDWSPPAAPQSCKLDYGQGIELRAGGAAAFVCAGDTALGGGEVLDYGQSIAAGLLRCESAESGMTCRDVESGRGFSIAKQGYEIF